MLTYVPFGQTGFPFPFAQYTTPHAPLLAFRPLGHPVVLLTHLPSLVHPFAYISCKIQPPPLHFGDFTHRFPLVVQLLDPAGQSLHSIDPGVSLYEPTEHVLQYGGKYCSRPGTEYSDPRGHFTHFPSRLRWTDPDTQMHSAPCTTSLGPHLIQVVDRPPVEVEFGGHLMHRLSFLA